MDCRTSYGAAVVWSRRSERFIKILKDRRRPGRSFFAKTVGVDPEICICGAKMILDDAITDVEMIAEVLARLGRRSARFNGSTKEAAISGGTLLCVRCVNASAQGAGSEVVRPHGSPAATRARFLHKSVRVGIDIFSEFLRASRV